MLWLRLPIPNPNKLLPIVAVDVGGEGGRKGTYEKNLAMRRFSAAGMGEIEEAEEVKGSCLEWWTCREMARA
jgi:hypothetical protein